MIYRIATFLLAVSALFPAATTFSQQLIYSQNNVSYTRGTIDSEVLIDLIQEKQKELNKFVLSRIVTKTWISSQQKGNNENASDRIDNFTTKYAIYSSLNDLTLAGNKADFGKNTLELLKESAMIFGLAVMVNDRFYGDTANFFHELKIGRMNDEQTALDFEKENDTIGFNQTIDMVLNCCITNPELAGYFPLYGQLANDEDENRVWYETDSRYYASRNDSAVGARYARVQQRIDAIYKLLKTLKQDWTEVGSGDLSPLLNRYAGQLAAYIIPKSERLQHIEADIRRIAGALEKFPVVRDQFNSLLKGDSLWFDGNFIQKVRQLRYDYTAMRGTVNPDTRYDEGKITAFLNAFKELIPPTDKALSKRWEAFKKDLDDQLKNGKTVPKSTVRNWLTATANADTNWRTIVNSTRLKGYTSDAGSLLENVLSDLEHLASRTEMIRALCKTIVTSQKSRGLNQFVFDEQQLTSAKALIDRFIDHVDKSGKYNVPAVYLRSIVDNISYTAKDTVTNQPATVSLSFESVILSLNSQLVTPARLERTRYFQPYINIGLNYAAFTQPNALRELEDGTFASLNSLTFASEKIGLKYKIINRRYTRSFKPGVVYRYYGKNWYWERPQQQGILDDLFLDVHTGGLLYNVVNLKTDENFSFPFVGAGVGVRFFNGLTASVSADLPYTGDAFRAKNMFVLFSLDVPIVEYISKLGK